MNLGTVWGIPVGVQIPGFPLDGGRVLRAAVWRWTGSYHRASRAASLTGQIVAFAFIGFGILGVFRGNLLGGVWMVLIGWFLQNAAAVETGPWSDATSAVFSPSTK